MDLSYEQYAAPPAGFQPVSTMYNAQSAGKQVQPVVAQPRTTIPFNHGLPTVRGIPLVSTHALPDRFRPIFHFPNFSAVQSKCYHAVYGSDDNLVVSAPTGSGKTVIFELAICRLLAHSEHASFKVVYMAPTKSLCSERLRDWQGRFKALGLNAAELTGDINNTQLRTVQQASIIITTPEKWDSITRKDPSQNKLMSLVKLFLVDEVHTLKEDRGATLEAVVARMMSSKAQVRFIALSATIPNCDDVAAWLGRNQTDRHTPARLETFGEDFRPVPITKHVVSFASSLNDFAFDKMLSAKLPSILNKYGSGKPALVFCSTRAGCLDTAKQLATWWQSSRPSDRAWVRSDVRMAFHDEELRDVSSAGVAFHHAGVSRSDRDTVESAFLAGHLSVLCCTSTLATGVNLPCHTVIVKNTATFHQNVTSRQSEYSDLDIVQMLGRAGRPQFDTSAVAVIMTRQHRVQHYEQLVSGEEIVESRLHHHLLDHINAEIRLSTISDVSSAKAWIGGTFLYQRLKHNRSHYQADTDDSVDVDRYLNNICRNGLSLLQSHDLIDESNGRFHTTALGDAMAYYCIQFETMKTFMSLPKQAEVPDILVAISKASEYEDIHFRTGEKQAYREINKSSAVRYPLQVHVDLTWQKVFLTIQMALSGATLPGNNQSQRQDYQQTKTLVFKHCNRLVKAIQDCAIHLNDAVMASNAFVLGRSLCAEAWDDLPAHLAQIDGVGVVGVRKLSQAGMRNFDDIAKSTTQRLEQVFSRNPPFGTQLLQKIDRFPRFRLQLNPGTSEVNRTNRCIRLHLTAEIVFLNEQNIITHHGKTIQVCFLAATSDGALVHFVRKSASEIKRNGKIIFHADLEDGLQTVQAQMMCEEIGGTCKTTTLKPLIPSSLLQELSTLPPRVGQLAKALPSHVLPSSAPHINSLRSGSEQYNDSGIQDQDLLGLDDSGFVHIDDVGVNDTPTNHVQVTATADPVMEANGRYRCRHTCKDRATCKHKCCREGLEKPPRPSKPKPGADTVQDEDEATGINTGNKHTLTQIRLSWPNQKKTAASTSQQHLGAMPMESDDAPDFDMDEDIEHELVMSDHQERRPDALRGNISSSSDLPPTSDLLGGGMEVDTTAQVSDKRTEREAAGPAEQQINLPVNQQSMTESSTIQLDLPIIQRSSPSANLSETLHNRAHKTKFNDSWDTSHDSPETKKALDAVRAFLGTKLFVFVD